MLSQPSTTKRSAAKTYLHIMRNAVHSRQKGDASLRGLQFSLSHSSEAKMSLHFVFNIVLHISSTHYRAYSKRPSSLTKQKKLSCFGHNIPKKKFMRGENACSSVGTARGVVG